MRKMKRVAALALVSALTVSMFAGCSKKENDDKFYIGGLGPLTGTAAQYGEAVDNAAKLAVDEINAAGGINGYEIEYKFEDDVADPEKAVNAYNSLVDWGMKILVGNVTSGAASAVAPLTYDNNMFQITPSASSTDVIKENNAFQVCFTDPNQGAASAKYIAEKKLATKVAVIYDSSDIYSSGIHQKFMEEAKAQGLNVVTEQAFTADSKTDFSVQVQKCKAEGADLVFLPIYYTEATLILETADSIGFKPTFFGCDGLDGILAVDGFDKKLAEDVMLLTPFSADSKDENVQKFVKSYKEKNNDTVPNQFAADAYDSIYIIKTAIEKADLKPDASVSDINDALKKAMTEITYDGLTGKGMTWAATGEVNKAPMAVIIKNGVYTSFEK